MGGWEIAALVLTVVAFGLAVRRIPRDARSPGLMGLLALLSPDPTKGRDRYSLAASLLGVALVVWALRIFHLAFYGPD